GGGALLIASSTSITVNGTIRADAGSSEDGVGGNGGAIRLVAPVIEGATGLLSAKGGHPNGIDGRVRLEAFENHFKGSLDEAPFSYGKPFGLFLPPQARPSVRVVSVGGVALSSPEFSINQPSPVTVVVEARYIPPGTVVELQFFPENGQDQSVTTTP